MIYNEFISLTNEIKDELESRGLDMRLEKQITSDISGKINEIAISYMKSSIEEDHIDARKREVFMDMYEYRDQSVRAVLQKESALIDVQTQEIRKIQEHIRSLESASIREEQDSIIPKLEKARERLQEDHSKFNEIEQEKNTGYQLKFLQICSILKLIFNILKIFCEMSEKTEHILKSMISLIKDMQRSCFEGIGKPEPLKHKLTGLWSRRIDDTNRIVYYEKMVYSIYDPAVDIMNKGRIFRPLFMRIFTISLILVFILFFCYFFEFLELCCSLSEGLFLKALIKSLRWTCILDRVKIIIPPIAEDIISSTGPNSGTITKWYTVIRPKNIETTQKIHINNQERMLVGWDNK